MSRHRLGLLPVLDELPLAIFASVLVVWPRVLNLDETCGKNFLVPAIVNKFAALKQIHP